MLKSMSHIAVLTSIDQRFPSSCPLNGKVQFLTPFPVCARVGRRTYQRCEKVNFSIEWTAGQESLGYLTVYLYK